MRREKTVRSLSARRRLSASQPKASIIHSIPTVTGIIGKNLLYLFAAPAAHPNEQNRGATRYNISKVMPQYMSSENIIKFCLFVILIGLLSLFTLNCSSGFPQDAFRSNANGLLGDAERSKDYGEPKVVGHIKDDAVEESSGVAASRCAPDVYWTHNDSGDDAFLYAFNLQGEKLGVWRVPGARNDDWEDIAAYKDPEGKCFLYVGDIGNNRHDRGQMTIYRVHEPQIGPGDSDASRQNMIFTEPAEAIEIKDPNFKDDAETLMVHPVTGDIYILAKSYKRPSAVYKLAAPFNMEGANSLQLVAPFSVPAVPDGVLTGGDISPDGKRVIVCDYVSAYELVLPAAAKNFDEIWKQKPLVITLGPRKTGEAVAYSADGKFLIATTEGKHPPVIVVERK
jgi:hypothetical protein